MRDYADHAVKNGDVGRNKILDIFLKIYFEDRLDGQLYVGFVQKNFDPNNWRNSIAIS